LSEAEWQRWQPHLEGVELSLGTVIYESRGPLSHVYFPTTAIVSLLYVTEQGASAEIAVVGSEGLVGISLFMGGESTPSRAVVQSAGRAYRMKAQMVKDEFVHPVAARAVAAAIEQLRAAAVPAPLIGDGIDLWLEPRVATVLRNAGIKTRAIAGRVEHHLPRAAHVLAGSCETNGDRCDASASAQRRGRERRRRDCSVGTGDHAWWASAQPESDAASDSATDPRTTRRRGAQNMGRALPHGRHRWNSRPSMVAAIPMRWESCRHRQVKAASTRNRPGTDRREGPHAAVSPYRRIALQIAATGPSPNEPSNVKAQTTTDTEPTTSLSADPERRRSNHSSTRTTQTNTIVMKTR
jgi:hypothetical protein